MSFFHSLLSAIVTSPDTTPDGKQVELIIGDSTAGDTSSALTLGPTTPSDSCYLWNGSGITELTTDDINNAGPTYGTLWKKYALDWNASSGRKPVFVNEASAGSEASPNGDNNNWSTSGDLYATAISNCDAALAFLNLTLPAVIHISLCINDVRGAVSLSTINTDLISLIDRLQAKYPGVPILLENIGRDETNLYSARIAAVRKYIKNIALTYADVHIVDGNTSLPANSLMAADNLHPSQAGNNERGAKRARWRINSSYSKWARSIIASHYDDLSTTIKDGWESFMTAAQSEYLDLDQLLILRNTDKKNTLVDFGYLAAPQDQGFTFNANTSISFNGSSTYYAPSLVPTGLWNKASQDDFVRMVKVVTATTAAGSSASLSSAYDGTIRIRMVQTSSSLISIISNAATATTNGTDTKYQANTWHGQGRDGGNQYLIKGSTDLATGAVASTGLCDRAPVLGAEDANGSITLYWNGSVACAYTGKRTTIDLSVLNSALDTLLALY